MRRTGVGRDYHRWGGLADCEGGSATSADVTAVGALHCDVIRAGRRGGSRRHGQRGIGKWVAAICGEGWGSEACSRSGWETRDDSKRPVDRSVPDPGSRDRECCAARCAVGKRAALGAYRDRTDARSICKVNIRLHRGLADSSHMELGALLYELNYEERVLDETAVCAGRDRRTVSPLLVYVIHREQINVFVRLPAGATEDNRFAGDIIIHVSPNARGVIQRLA